MGGKTVRGKKKEKVLMLQFMTHEVKVNMFYKGHVERVQINICKLGKTDVILGIPCITNSYLLVCD